MRANERLNEIVKILNKQGRVHVKDLSQMFEVTEDLIRKDLKKLEEKDLIDRIYGGAERKTKKFDVSNVKYRMNINKDEKEIIVKKAEALIENGDVIFLDTSTTTATLAALLARGHKELTVITNMLEIVRILEGNNDIITILIGGLYNRKIGGFVGQEAVERIEEYYVNQAFISCMSVDLEDGVLVSSTKDIGLSKTAILKQARQKILLLETRKFEHEGMVKFYDLRSIDVIIAERAFNENEKNRLNKLKVEML